jgi:TolA-binding protein
LNFRLGEALAKQNKWAEALPPLLKVTTEAPQSEWAGPAIWLAGQALENTGARADAVALYRQLAGRQPATEWTAKADAKVKELAP